MSAYRRRWTMRSFMYSPLGVVLAGLVALLLARSAWGVYKKEQIARARDEEALYELYELRARKAGLSRDIERLESEEGIEKAARAKFQVAKPGEKVIVIMDDTATTTQVRSY